MKPSTNTETKPIYRADQVYLKGCLFQALQNPTVLFQESSNALNPKIQYSMQTGSNILGSSTYEITLSLDIKCECQEKKVALWEMKLQQAGAFTIKGFAPEVVEKLVHGQCLNEIYPYAREMMTSTVIKAGFPAAYLPHIDFFAVYQQSRQSQQQPTVRPSQEELKKEPSDDHLAQSDQSFPRPS